MLGTGATVGVKLIEPGLRVESGWMDELEGVLVRCSPSDGMGDCGGLDVGPSFVLELGTVLERKVAGKLGVDGGGAGPVYL